MQPTPTLSPILYFVTRLTNRCNDTRDLVARNHGEGGAPPLIAGLMNIGVTDTAKFDVEGYVVLAGFTPFEGIGPQKSLGAGSGVSFSFYHDVFFSCHGIDRGLLP